MPIWDERTTSWRMPVDETASAAHRPVVEVNDDDSRGERHGSGAGGEPEGCAKASRQEDEGARQEEERIRRFVQAGFGTEEEARAGWREDGETGPLCPGDPFLGGEPEEARSSSGEDGEKNRQAAVTEFVRAGGGRAVVRLGDCRAALREMADGSWDHVITDSPRSTVPGSRGDRHHVGGEGEGVPRWRKARRLDVDDREGRPRAPDTETNRAHAGADSRLHAAGPEHSGPIRRKRDHVGRGDANGADGAGVRGEREALARSLGQGGGGRARLDATGIARGADVYF